MGFSPDTIGVYVSVAGWSCLSRDIVIILIIEDKRAVN